MNSSRLKLSQSPAVERFSVSGNAGIVSLAEVPHKADEIEKLREFARKMVFILP